MKKWKTTILVTIISVGAILPLSMKESEKHFQISKNLEILASLIKELNTYYVDEIQPSQLVNKGIKSMLNSLDPYTVFYSESEIEDYKFQTTGKYGGIGARIQQKDDYVIIVAPYVGFPAYEAGLRAGDKIKMIDGKSAQGKTAGQVSNILRGAPGTEVSLTIERPPVGEQMEVTIKREEIKISSVRYSGMVNGDIGYIQLRSFTKKAGQEVKESFEQLKENHPEMKGVVLDLRNNPGGLLNEAVNISNIFISKGNKVVSTKGKIKEWEKTYRTLDPAVDSSIPLAILVNKNSASASEIVAGAVQDLDRGVVIGRQTFGKGLVQTTRSLAYNSKLKVTTARYYIPSGRCIQAIDYSKGENGNGKKVADSLKTQFTTRNGRVVYDSDGITPDIQQKRQKLSNIAAILRGKNLIFDFATLYHSRHDSIAPPKQFEIADSTYENFKAFLSDKEYSYTTKTEELYQKLEKSAQQEKFYDAIQKDLKHLQESIHHDKKKDLEKFKAQITELLEEEIVSRYYFKEGKTAASFDSDSTLLHATRLLHDSARYHEILQPKPEH